MTFLVFLSGFIFAYVLLYVLLSVFLTTDGINERFKSLETRMTSVEETLKERIVS